MRKRPTPDRLPPIEVTCPTCGVSPGEQCLTASMAPQRLPHRAREHRAETTLASPRPTRAMLRKELQTALRILWNRMDASLTLLANRTSHAGVLLRPMRNGVKRRMALLLGIFENTQDYQLRRTRKQQARLPDHQAKRFPKHARYQDRALLVQHTESLRADWAAFDLLHGVIDRNLPIRYRRSAADLSAYLLQVLTYLERNCNIPHREADITFEQELP